MKSVSSFLEKIGGGHRFACFNPFVMQMTFVIEICLMTYVLLVRKRSLNTYIIVAILFFLATFQLAEYAICKDMPGSDDLWLKIGMLSITALPPLGVHLTTRIAGSRHSWLPILAYSSGLVYAGLFISGTALGAPVCAGNYVITQFDGGLWGRSYAIYYYGWLLAAMGKQLFYIGHHSDRDAHRDQRRKSLVSLLTGYLAFAVPSTVIVVFNSGVPNDSLPSIMCGFALLLALVIGFSTSAHTDKIK